MSRFRKDRYLTPPSTEREEPLKDLTYKVTGTPPPTPVFYHGKLIGWKVAGEEAIYPASHYRSNQRLFDKT